MAVCGTGANYHHPWPITTNHIFSLQLIQPALRPQSFWPIRVGLMRKSAVSCQFSWKHTLAWDTPKINPSKPLTTTLFHFQIFHVFSWFCYRNIEKNWTPPRDCHEDGDFELQRKVPYDYDSEFQDMFMRIASALYNGHMTLGLAEKCAFFYMTKQQSFWAEKDRITCWYASSFDASSFEKTWTSQKMDEQIDDTLCQCSVDIIHHNRIEYIISKPPKIPWGPPQPWIFPEKWEDDLPTLRTKIQKVACWSSDVFFP